MAHTLIGAGEFMTVSSLFSPHTPSSGRINVTLERARAWREALMGDTPTNRRLYFEDQPWTVDLAKATALGKAELSTGTGIPVISRLFAAVVVNSQVNALSRQVRELHHRAALAADEHGQWTLQHIHGLMHLPAQPSEDPKVTNPDVLAPIFVQPVRLDPVGSPVRDWMIESTGPWDINRELLFRLARDWGVNPDPAAILDAYTTQGFGPGIRVLTEALGKDTGWRVEDRQLIDLLTPSPLAPLVELERLTGRLPKLPLVAAVAGSTEAQEEVVKAVRIAMPKDLPDRLAYDEDSLVLDTDSSQHEAINMALAGASLVIQGPPGTGKSQTIANLAVALAQRGQRVLVTSPKAVALDNLVARLDTIGLGELVADVRAVRSVDAILGELHDQVADLDANPVGEDTPDPSDREVWGALRRDLAEWVEVMHAPRDPWGLSYFEARQEAIRLAEGPRVPGWTMSRAALDTLTEDTRTRTRGELRAWAGLRKRLDQAGVPWQAEQVHDEATVEAILSTVELIRTQWLPSAMAFRRHFASTNTITRIPTVERWAEILDLVAGMEESIALLGPEAFSGELDELYSVYASKRTKTLRVFNREYREAQRKLNTMFNAANHPGMTVESVATRALEQQAQWRELAHTRVPEGTDEFAQAKVCHEQLHEALTWLSTLLVDTDLCAKTHEEVADIITAMAASTDVITLLPELASLDDQIRAAHVYPIVDAVRLGDLHVDQVEDAFDAEWLRALIHVLTTEDDTLRAFDGRDANARLEAWQQADRAHLLANRAQVLQRLRERSQQVIRFKRDEADALRAGVAEDGVTTRARGRRKLQQLWRNAPEVLPTLRPIWVMGPDDVAEVLPTDAVFDVVIVDEASLMKPERAIGGLARSKRMVIVGDRHQLPPVTRRWTTDQPSSVTDDRNRANLFDIAQGFLPVVHLAWSHRAQDARLINAVADGVYPEGFFGFPGTLVSSPLTVHIDTPDVIDAVVSAMVRHALAHPEQSLGVVCPSMTTTVAVSEALAKHLTTQDGTPAAPFFTHGDDEPVFIKPVDAVQGEERDVIILMLPRTEFDAYVGDLGQRRGVVAATRARQTLHLITDLNPSEVAELKAYQDPGAQLMSTLLEGDKTAHDQYLDDHIRPLFEAMAQSFEEAGMPVATGVGQPPIGVRMAVCHPVQRERLVLAIAVDGVLYRDLPTVRDRERIHRDGLVNRGWAVHRMWLHEWFSNPKAAIDQARAAWEAAVKVTDQRDREAAAERDAIAQSIGEKRERQEAEARELATAQQRMRQSAIAEDSATGEAEGVAGSAGAPSPEVAKAHSVPHGGVRVTDEGRVVRQATSRPAASAPQAPQAAGTHGRRAATQDSGEAAQAIVDTSKPEVHDADLPAAAKPVEPAHRAETGTPEVKRLEPDHTDGRPNLPKGLKIERHAADDLAALAKWIMMAHPTFTDDQISAEMMQILGYTRKGKRIQSRFERAIRTAKKG